MARIRYANGEVGVFKYKETGLVELCAEVTDYVRKGIASLEGVDPDSAVFSEDEHCFVITFKKKGDE